VWLTLDSAAFDRLAAEARSKGYKALPAADSGYPTLKPFARRGARGLYLLEEEKAANFAYRLAVLDAATKRLIAERAY
jgi:hypothetical protein